MWIAIKMWTRPCLVHSSILQNLGQCLAHSRYMLNDGSGLNDWETLPMAGDLCVEITKHSGGVDRRPFPAVSGYSVAHWLGSGLRLNKTELQICDSQNLLPVPFKIRNSKGGCFLITVEHPTVFILNATDLFRKITYFLCWEGWTFLHTCVESEFVGKVG